MLAIKSVQWVVNVIFFSTLLSVVELAQHWKYVLSKQFLVGNFDKTLYEIYTYCNIIKTVQPVEWTVHLSPSQPHFHLPKKNDYVKSIQTEVYSHDRKTGSA